MDVITMLIANAFAAIRKAKVSFANGRIVSGFLRFHYKDVHRALLCQMVESLMPRFFFPST